MADHEPTAQNHSDGPKLDDHNYDGIQEYDNPIPGWWSWIFVATVAFAPAYIVWFHAPGMGRTIAERYDQAYAANLEKQFGEIGELSPDAATILKYSTDPQWLAVGASTFQTNCVSCHGSNAEGKSGPNLTDDAYLNVDSIDDIATVINHGAANGAMPAWSTRLHPNAVVLTASYVASLRGTNAADGKAPQGDVIAPWAAE